MAIVYTDIPALEKWKKDSSVTLASRSKDVILARIDELVDAVGRAADAGARLYLVSDLFFTIDYWLKIYKTNPSMERKREPAVMALYKCVVDELCTSYGCSVNVLPRELEYYFGREMGFHGAKLDLALDCASYLKRADTRKYKLWFRNGLAYQFPWWDPKAKTSSKLVRAESRRAYEPAVFQGPGRVNWGGFAMSMGRDIYMAKHHCTKGFGQNGNFYHSSYMGGAPVMCAGTMLIENGVIRGVSTDSGHYQPSKQHVVNLLQSLKMVGVDLGRIAVQDHFGQSFVEATADAFLYHQGNWTAALARRQANISHLAIRLQETIEFENGIKKLWDRGVQDGLFSDDMAGRVYFAGVCLPHYTNSQGKSPYQGINFLYALNALARATGRNPDAYEVWLFEEWTRYMRQYKVTDSPGSRSQFAQFEASLPQVRNAGWTAQIVLDVLEKAYKNKNLPWN